MWNDIKFLNAATRVVMGIGIVYLVLTLLWFVIHRPMFDLNVIRVQGMDKAELKHVSAETIRSTAVPVLNGNFFTTNLDQSRLAFERVPWVRKAKVRREWPDTLIVSVEEYEPLGTWGDNGQLLSTKGDIFVANLAEAEEDADLLAFSGPAGTEKDVLAHYQEFKDWFKHIALEPEEVNYSQRYAWLIKLNNGLMVQLGREDDSKLLKARVDRLLQVYPELAKRLQGKITSVDLRYPNGFALAR